MTGDGKEFELSLQPCGGLTDQLKYPSGIHCKGCIDLFSQIIFSWPLCKTPNRPPPYPASRNLPLPPPWLSFPWLSLATEMLHFCVLLTEPQSPIGCSFWSIDSFFRSMKRGLAQGQIKRQLGILWRPNEHSLKVQAVFSLPKATLCQPVTPQTTHSLIHGPPALAVSPLPFCNCLTHWSNC